MHRDRSSTSRKSARVSNGPVGSATSALATPTCFALLHTPSPPPPGPLNRTPRTAGIRHHGLLEPRRKGVEGCTVINAMHGGGGLREHSPMFDLEAGGELYIRGRPPANVRVFVFSSLPCFGPEVPCSLLRVSRSPTRRRVELSASGPAKLAVADFRFLFYCPREMSVESLRPRGLQLQGEV